jgi:outer membrane protein TolC
MRRNGFIATLFVLALGGAAMPAAAQTSDARIQELIRAAAARAGATLGPNGELQQAAPQAGAAPSVRLTLDDAVKLALDRNLDIAVQRLNPQINDIAIASALAVYHPIATSTINTQSTSTPANNTLAGSNTAGAPVINKLGTFNGGVTQALPWLGSSLNVLLNNNRQTTSSLNTLYNPTFNTNWSAAYTQPLFRNLAIDSNRRTIQVSRINRDISDVALKSTIMNTLSNVRNAYWDYVFAVQSVDVAQQSVTLAEQLVRDNQTRVEVGTMAPIDVVQAQSQSATARQNLAVAQQTMQTAEVALKRLIVAGTQDPNWNAKLDPIDRPDFAPVAIDVEAAVKRALSERTDLEIAKKTTEMNDITLKFLRDQLKPQADLVATYGMVGLGGSQLITTGTGVNRTVTGSIPGGYTDALQTMLGNGCPSPASGLGCFPRWTVQVNFSYPLGASAQEAAVARSRVQLNQIQAQTRQIELQVATDVTNAAVIVQTNVQRVQAAQAARELAQKQLEAEQSKFEVGMSTNYNVIQSQRDLATAQNNELQSILNYRKSLVELERLQQTTLQSLNITILNAVATGGTGGGATTTGGGGGGGGGQ